MIIWGTKRVEKKVGFVAEFCPICRSINPFRIVRIGMAGHVYYISFGSGQLVGHDAECQQCRNVKTVDPTVYTAFEPKGGMELGALIQKTFPKIREAYAGRLDLEEKIQRHPSSLAPSDREALLMEPFQYLSGQVEARYAGSTQFDRESGIGCLGTILVAVLVFIASVTCVKAAAAQNKALIATGVLFAAGLIYTFVQLGLAPGRFVRRKIIPNLARALKPLNPRREELISCLDKLKAAQFRIGQKVRVEQLCQALQSQR